MGAKAAPYLGKQVARRSMVDAGTPDFGYYEPLLKAFEILGSNAQPATPYLVKSVGLNFDCSERALLLIGKGAVPPLADKLLATLSDTKSPFYFGGIRTNIRKDSGYFIRGRILSVFDRMETNAEAALPALLFAASTNLPVYRERMYPQNLYATLAIVGRNRPEVVAPVLIRKFKATDSERDYIATAMAIFGTNQADAFMPVLIPALSESTTNVYDRTSIGLALTEISGGNQECLVPVFLAALVDKTSPEPVRCAMAGYLAKVGKDRADIVVPVLKTAYTNASLYGRSSIAGALACFPMQAGSMVPLMLSDCERKAEHPWGNHWRISLTLAIRTIAPDQPGTLKSLLKDLNDSQASIRQQTIYALGGMGTNGMEAVPMLLKCMIHPDGQTRIDTMRALNQIGVSSEEYVSLLGSNLFHTNYYVCDVATQTLRGLATNSPSAMNALFKAAVVGARESVFPALESIASENPSLFVTSLENSDPSVRYQALLVIYRGNRQIPECIPGLVKLLEDSDTNVREFAQRLLWLQDQKKAKELGVKSPFHY